MFIASVSCDGLCFSQSRTPMRGLKALGGLLMLGRCVQGQPEESEEDTSSVWPLLLVVFFAFVGMFATMCALVQQIWRQWKRCRVCLSRQAFSTVVQEPEHKKVVGATVYGSSSRSSSSTNGDAQLVARRGRDLHAVWARTEEQKWKALNSVCITCGQQVDEPLAASCDNCHRRMHSLASCGRTCRCSHTLCFQCFHRHRCS